MSSHNLYRYLDTVGDGSGTKDARGNYSSTPARFKIVPPAGEIFYIARMIIHYQDVGAPDADKYGNNITLANGITIGIYNVSDDSLHTELTDGLPIKTNAEWGRLAYDVRVDNFGVGNDFVQVRWSFFKSQRTVILGEDQYLGIILSDDFSGLVSHHFMAQGKRSVGLE